jgi:hypothetical protein
MRTRRSRRKVALLATIVIIVCGLGLTLRSSWFSDLVAKPAPTNPPRTVAVRLSPDEEAFYDAVVPRMVTVTSEAKVLADLGSRHSRNLLELQTRGNRINDNAKQIEAYVGENGVPRRFEAAYGGFSQGMLLLRRAMQDSRQGMISLDWDKVATSISVFESGAEAVASATEELQRDASEATPVSDQVRTVFIAFG